MLTRVLKMRLAAGALAASALAGCQSASQQFARPGVARGDTGLNATSPAFAQVAAGTQMAAHMPMMPPSHGMTMMNPSMPMGSYQMASGQPIMGSGGQVIQPIAYSSAGPQVMQPTPMMHQMSPQVIYQQPTMPASPMPMPANQPTYMLINTPQGPQYVIVQEMPATAATPMPATPMPATSAPAPVTMPAAATPSASTPTPMTTPAAPTVAAPIPMPTPAPAVTPAGTTVSTPIETIAAPEPAPVAPAPTPAPVTFTAPPLTSVPMPSMPALPTPADSMPKAPEPLPRSMSAKSPTGPVFPTATQGPSLGAFPAAPSPSAMPSPILPPITHVTGDDIPSAPSFLPSPR